MNDKELVSIIIPAYNAEKTIERLLDTIVNQSYTKLKIIIVDDGSVDNTYSICRKMALLDTRIHVIKQENSGVSSARNRGLNAADGKYVMFADADDSFSDSEAIKKLVMKCEDRSAHLVSASYNLVKTRGRVVECVFHDEDYYGSEYYDNIIKITSIIPHAPWGKVFLLDIIREKEIRFPENVKVGEDGIFLMEYLKNIANLSITSDIVYNYNYTNVDSAVNSFHSNMGMYMYQLGKKKEETCRFFLGAEFDSDVMKEFYERAVKHYIIKIKDKDQLITYLRQTHELFYNSPQYKGMDELIIRNWWAKYVQKWKKEHLRSYIIERLKMSKLYLAINKNSN